MFEFEEKAIRNKDKITYTSDGVKTTIKIDGNKVITNKALNLKPVNIETKVYPGFATDLQQPITTLLVMADGESTVRETIYENRFQNTIYLNSMGADIIRKGDTIYVNGPTKLEGKLVRTSDLRAGAALIIAGIIATNHTIIRNIEILFRGYEKPIQKLKQLNRV